MKIYKSLFAKIIIGFSLFGFSTEQANGWWNFIACTVPGSAVGYYGKGCGRIESLFYAVLNPMHFCNGFQEINMLNSELNYKYLNEHGICYKLNHSGALNEDMSEAKKFINTFAECCEESFNTVLKSRIPYNIGFGVGFLGVISGIFLVKKCMSNFLQIKNKSFFKKLTALFVGGMGIAGLGYAAKGWYDYNTKLCKNIPDAKKCVDEFLINPLCLTEMDRLYILSRLDSLRLLNVIPFGVNQYIEFVINKGLITGAIAGLSGYALYKAWRWFTSNKEN